MNKEDFLMNYITNKADEFAKGIHFTTKMPKEFDELLISMAKEGYKYGFVEALEVIGNELFLSQTNMPNELLN